MTHDTPVWLNGEIIPMSEAHISVEDRGFQFADGVYELIRLYNGRLFAVAEHLQRLERSCRGILIDPPLEADELARQIHRLIEASGVIDSAAVYLQITRGAAERNHRLPACRPTMLFYARPLPPSPPPGEAPGVRLQSVPDDRWKRCWIKSIALLPNVLAKHAAIAAGADEAAFIEDGCVTECSSSNLVAIIDGRLITAPPGPKVLGGITRAVLLQCAAELGIAVEERPLSEQEAKQADEIFITSTTREAGWVGQWDGQAVGGGRCGKLTIHLHQALLRHIQRQTGTG